LVDEEVEDGPQECRAALVRGPGELAPTRTPGVNTGRGREGRDKDEEEEEEEEVEEEVEVRVGESGKEEKMPRAPRFDAPAEVQAPMAWALGASRERVQSRRVA
jgi:hypothetical protein